MKSITMTGERVLVELKARKTESDGGIVIPEFSQVAETWGTVKAIGPKVKDLKLEDEVMVEKHLGTHIVKGGSEFIIIEESKIQLKKV